MPSDEPILLDGSLGEGGGQILRTALALSVVTGKPFRIERIRANRPKPGLRRQHLTAVRAAAEICAAAVEGDEVDSGALWFRPGPLRAGDYAFDVGSAGSTMLVLQTVLPPLLGASRPSVVRLAGGTHNFGAPPFDFLQHAFLPLVNRMGPRVDLELERAGFAPAGGGRATARIIPAAHLRPLHLSERGKTRGRLLKAAVAGLPADIARRELDTALRALGWPREAGALEELPPDQGPGNIVTIEVHSEHLSEVFTAFGQRGVPAEKVARGAAKQARDYLNHAAPVGEHLADQLLLPLALAGGGSFITGPLSLHATTNIETIRRFLDVPIAVDDYPGGGRRVRVGAG